MRKYDESFEITKEMIEFDLQHKSPVNYLGIINTQDNDIPSIFRNKTADELNSIFGLTEISFLQCFGW